MAITVLVAERNFLGRSTANKWKQDLAERAFDLVRNLGFKSQLHSAFNFVMGTSHTKDQVLQL